MILRPGPRVARNITLPRKVCSMPRKEVLRKFSGVYTKFLKDTHPEIRNDSDKKRCNVVGCKRRAAAQKNPMDL